MRFRLCIHMHMYMCICIHNNTIYLHSRVPVVVVVHTVKLLISTSICSTELGSLLPHGGSRGKASRRLPIVSGCKIYDASTDQRTRIKIVDGVVVHASFARDGVFTCRFKMCC